MRSRWESTDFEAAQAQYREILTSTPYLFVQDEVRLRARLGVLALAGGDDTLAQAEFERVLEILPNWELDPDEYSPSVRDFVAALRSGSATP